jgi:hypothetical protein
MTAATKEIDMIDAREFLATKTLSFGAHCAGDRTDPSCAMCAREALCYAVTGKAYDRTPDGYPSWWAALTPLNDGLTDADRQVVLRPRLWRYAVAAEPERDERIVSRLVTLAVTRFAAEACRNLHEHAEKLRAFGPIGPHNATTAADACASAAAACAADACASAAAACAADACASAAAACRRAAAAYQPDPRAECVYHDHLAEAASSAAFAAAYSSVTSNKRRIRYFSALLDAIDEELDA